MMLFDEKASVCAQNISKFENGAYTGEISAEQLVDFRIGWTLVGHSERRKLFGDTNAIVAEKVKAARSKKLNVILCIGETLEDREGERTNEVLAEQLSAVKAEQEDWTDISIAYEPVWAIGTGKVATPDQAQDAHLFIRNWVKENISEDLDLRIIYGGSVNDKNCSTLIKQEDIDGVLVGGASLKPTFKDIVESAHDFAKNGISEAWLD